MGFLTPVLIATVMVMSAAGGKTELSILATTTLVDPLTHPVTYEFTVQDAPPIVTGILFGKKIFMLLRLPGKSTGFPEIWNVITVFAPPTLLSVNVVTVIAVVRFGYPTLPISSKKATGV